MVPAALAAQTPMITDRPDQTESALTVPVGLLQVELGSVFEQTRGAGRLDALTVGGALLRYGLHPRLEARLGFAGWMRTELQGAGPVSVITQGVGDLDLGAKVRLAPEGSAYDLAILAGTTLPTGAQAFTTDQVDPNGRIAFAVPLTDRVGLGLNAGAFGTAGRADGLYTAVLGFTLSDRVGAFAESYGTLPISAGGAAVHALDGGVTLLLTPTLQLDASGGVGLNANAADWFVGAGVSVRVGR